jgi:hypothetical protein
LDFALQLWSSFGFCSAAMEQLWILLCSYGSALDFALQLWSSFGFCSAAAAVEELSQGIGCINSI